MQNQEPKSKPETVEQPSGEGLQSTVLLARGCSAATCSPFFYGQKDNADKEEEAEPLFTIAEIADYVAGWHLSTESGALANALNQLHDDQDGILAVRERKQSLENVKLSHEEGGKEQL